MDLNGIWIFTQVVRHGGFTAAARATGVPKSTISRKLRALEQSLGAVLLLRSTRSVQPTEIGAAYFERCEAVLRELDQAKQLICQSLNEVRGRLRVTAPVEMGQQALGPIVADFLSRHPGVHVELVLLDRTVDLLAEGFDVALRVGPLPDSNLIARRLGWTRWRLVAQPELAARLDSWENAPRLAFSGRRADTDWAKPGARLVANTFGSLLEAACRGHGVACVPSFLCHEALRDGRLQRVFVGQEPPDAPLFAVFPPRHALLPKVRSFLELLEQAWQRPPWGEVA